MPHNKKYQKNSNQCLQRQSNSKQVGFTLVELMISLVLGLLIAAAAFQVFYISQRTSTAQSSASDIQDSAVFGIQSLEHDIRLANFRAGSHDMNRATPHGGIIFNSTNAPIELQAAANQKFYTNSNTNNPSYYDTHSDQLTIQFVAPQNNTINCEGESVDEGVRLVQRYYLRRNNSTTPASFDLVCDAAVLGKPSSTNKTLVDNAGTVLISNVEQFKVLLMTENGYKDISTYNPASAVGDGEPIYGVKLGLVLAGANPTIQAQDNVANLKLFGNDLTKATSETTVNTVRRVYEPTILIRNARIR